MLDAVSVKTCAIQNSVLCLLNILVNTNDSCNCFCMGKPIPYGNSFSVVWSFSLDELNNMENWIITGLDKVASSSLFLLECCWLILSTLLISDEMRMKGIQRCFTINILENGCDQSNFCTHLSWNTLWKRKVKLNPIS